MKRILRAGLLLATVVSAVTSQTPKARQPSPLKTGIDFFDAEQLEPAKATLTPLARSGDAVAMYYLGRIAIEQSDGEAAIDWLDQAIKQNEHSSLYYEWLGIAYEVKASASNMFGKMSIGPAVMRAMERAVQLDSTNIEARVNLAQLYLQSPTVMGGGVEKAREQVAAIMKRDPYQGRLQEASIAENLKDALGAERMLRDMVSTFPDSSAPAIRYASYYLTLKRYDDSFRVLEDRLRHSPDDATALYQLGRVGAVSGANLDRAQWALDRYLTIQHKRGLPTLAMAHWRRGMVLEARGDKKTAQAEYETALRVDPKLAGAKTSLDKLESQQPEKQS
jgi:tetratricopeptide (TPR) repeat protein